MGAIFPELVALLTYLAAAVGDSGRGYPRPNQAASPVLPGRSLKNGEETSDGRHGGRCDYATNSTIPVDRSYIAPVIWMVAFFSRSSRIGLRRRISPSASTTFVRAMAST